MNKTCNVSDISMSYIQLHINEKRATPINFMKYRLAIQLFKIYNGHTMNDDCQDMNVQQNFNARNNKLQINDHSNIKIGKNILCSKLKVLNNLVELDWLNISLYSFKIKAKNVFLTN